MNSRESHILAESLSRLPGTSLVDTFEEKPNRAADSESMQLKFQFSNDAVGTTDQLLLQFVAMRVGASLQTKSSSGKSSLTVRGPSPQITSFFRYLQYGSGVGMAPEYPSARLNGLPLNALLSRVLQEFTCAYEKDLPEGFPSLAAASNVLQVFADEEIDQRKFNELAVLSTRVRKIVLGNAERLGWIKVRKDPDVRGKTMLSLTNLGTELRDDSSKRLTKLDKSWSKKFGAKEIERLKTHLANIVAQHDIEYPRYITGYGAADPSITGGNYRSGIEGPPRIPSRGAEFPVVLQRRELGEVRASALSVLLSQVLSIFAMDFESFKVGQLGHSSVFFQLIPDGGRSLGEVRDAGGITGEGKSLHERHMNVVLTNGKASDNTRKVYLTSKARVSRDAYLPVANHVEKTWQEKFGEATVSELRAFLESLVETIECEYTDFPHTTRWILLWHNFLVHHVTVE